MVQNNSNIAPKKLWEIDKDENFTTGRDPQETILGTPEVNGAVAQINNFTITLADYD